MDQIKKFPHSISPADFLQRLKSQKNSAPTLALLTGASGAGKTTWCLELVRLARAAGFSPVGLVSPAVFEAGVKKGFDLLDVASGVQYRMAVPRSEPTPIPPPGSQLLHWEFDHQVISWGNRILDHLPVSDLLLLDELGPLEFYHGAGFLAGLRRLDARLDRTACVVIRPGLLETALARWPWGQVWAVGEADQS